MHLASAKTDKPTNSESLGICLGAASISMVTIKPVAGQVQIIRAGNQVHAGRPIPELIKQLLDIPNLQHTRICTTGRKSRHSLQLTTITEAQAIELACRQTLPDKHPYRLIISAGGETTMIYLLDQSGRVIDAHTGNKCAAGSGEFFLQQLRRMAIEPEALKDLQLPEKYFKVSGRCSVFCKSDCTHALNSGIPKDEVVAGFSQMMATKIIELWQKFPKQPTLLIGGGSRNPLLQHYLKQKIEHLRTPPAATCFEALGAALWAHKHKVRPCSDPNNLMLTQPSNYAFLQPLSDHTEMVEFKNQSSACAQAGDNTVIGLDVGSTTTKGVVIRRRDRAVLARTYLQTNGDPIGAARKTYTALSYQIRVPISIDGVGITGSGRKIAGLHAMSKGVINEIVAHATGAVYYDSQVDTVFEIGGQDAKYISLNHGTPDNYAMNEACSAGTGSFLEEAAFEYQKIHKEQLADIALQSTQPTDFNDQCAAFIGSDIKQAIQDEIPAADICAGLVYSVCKNYLNRVKGNRPVGEKIFMQGGTCYNRAVPIAMAALTGKKIIVPPDPGLTGAFGVALEVDRRIKHGTLKKEEFDLQELAARNLTRKKSFVCKGTLNCDRSCKIARFEINDHIFPLGGSCSRYENLGSQHQIQSSKLNLALWREERVFQAYKPDAARDGRPTVGMNRSFLIHTYFPFYNCFFNELGFKLLLPEAALATESSRAGTNFCHPAATAHTYAASLLKLKPDFIFMPQIRHTSRKPTAGSACTCVFVQGEPSYLRSALPHLKSAKTITPTLDFARPLQNNLPAFIETAIKLGIDPEQTTSALEKAVLEQERFFTDLEQVGRSVLSQLSPASKKPTIVLFGRAYNSFTDSANLGIPAKFASRGYQIIPFDLLPGGEKKFTKNLNLYWGMGQMLLEAANFVKQQPQLFAVYITSFSCGPDSFLINYFRECMGCKPTLVLELDNHTADAGLETRIEAFLDIVENFKQNREKLPATTPYAATGNFKPAFFIKSKRKPGIQTASGWFPLSHPRVKIILPAMSRFGSPLLARAFKRVNIRATTLPPADTAALQLGRENSSCKECLPLHTTLGSLLNYLAHKRPPDEISVYLMGSSEGPCRFGQYRVFTEKVLQKKQLTDVAVLSPSSINGYTGLGKRFMLAAWRALVIGDLFDEMWAAILAAAVNRKTGLQTLNREFNRVLTVIDKDQSTILKQLGKSADNLQNIPLVNECYQIPKLSLVGEIYVRHDPFSLQGLNEYLADQGFIVRTAGNIEWFNYIDWLIDNNIEGSRPRNFQQQLWIKRKIDRLIRNRLVPTGLLQNDADDIESLLRAGSKFVSPDLTCETILTVGAALHNILTPACGIISISPFACMPSRIAETILNTDLTTSTKKSLSDVYNPNLYHLLQKEQRLPFLALETDGSVFPQIINARLEIFLLQAKRLHETMLAGANCHPAKTNYQFNEKRLA